MLNYFVRKIKEYLCVFYKFYSNERFILCFYLNFIHKSILYLLIKKIIKRRHLTSY